MKNTKINFQWFSMFEQVGEVQPTKLKIYVCMIYKQLLLVGNLEAEAENFLAAALDKRQKK